MNIVAHGTPIYHNSDWGGGKFNVELQEGMDITLVRRDTAWVPIHAKLGQIRTVHGSDSDHGRTEHWEFRDYQVILPDDVIDRGTQLLSLLKRKQVRVYAGRLMRAEVMLFHPDPAYYKGDVIPPSYIANNLPSLLHHMDELHYMRTSYVRKHEGAEIILRQAGYSESLNSFVCEVRTVERDLLVGTLTALVDPPKRLAEAK